MRIAILTEGISEFKSLPLLYPQLHAHMPARSKIVKTLKINVQPDAHYAQVIASCRPSLAVARSVSDKILVLLDREQQQRCPGHLADELERAFNKENGDGTVRVVLKDRTYENWLIADLDALRAHPGRFMVDNSAEKKIMPNKADSLNGLSQIKRMMRNGEYSKTQDSERICRTADVRNMGQHSRSFRHFLHLLGYEPYRDECRLPVRPQHSHPGQRRRR